MKQKGMLEKIKEFFGLNNDDSQEESDNEWIDVKKDLQENKVPATKKKEEKTAKSDMDEYMCKKCKYNFKVNKKNIGKLFKLKCPYCGKPNDLKKL